MIGSVSVLKKKIIKLKLCRAVGRSTLSFYLIRIFSTEIVIPLRPISIYHAHPEGKHIRNKTTTVCVEPERLTEESRLFISLKTKSTPCKTSMQKKTYCHASKLTSCQIKRFENCCLYVLQVRVSIHLTIYVF